MARIGLVREAEATGRVKEIYEDIKDTMGWGFVPETFPGHGAQPRPFGCVLVALQIGHGAGES